MKWFILHSNCDILTIKERERTEENMKRVFLIVLDSFGIGGMEDAPCYGDVNVNTLRTVSSSPYFHMPHMRKLGLFRIDGVELAADKACGLEKKADVEPSGLAKKAEAQEAVYEGAYARMTEASQVKDTTIVHWEIAGIWSP